jgi:MYXO-CTERM domain-containing protein
MHIQTTNGDGFEWWILKDSTDGVTVLSHAVVSVEGGTASSSHAAVPVVVGDSFYLVVGPNGNYGGDTTQIEFAVTVAETVPPVVSTPASSAWSVALLMGLGFAAVAVTRRRRATTSA